PKAPGRDSDRLGRRTYRRRPSPPARTSQGAPGPRMTLTLTRHVVRLVGGRILAALAVLVGILQILDLLDVTTDILDRQLGAGGVAYYALLRMPRLIEQAAPLAVLAGALFAFTQLARESAVTAMRS